MPALAVPPDRTARSRRFFVLGAAAGLAARGARAQAPAASEGPVYTVELVVFRALSAGASEDWTVTPPAPPRGDSGDSASGAAIVGRLVSSTAPAQLQLNDLKSRLAASGTYQPLAHAGWSQTASSWGSRAGFALTRLGVNAQGLTGSIYLERGSYLHLGVALRYASGAQSATFALHELRRVRFYERNYYDHPAFGAIALVTPAQGARAPGR
jgi:hypothetical protein